MNLTVDADGWVQQFPNHPGPKDKVYSQRNKGLFIVNHSIVGTAAAALGRFLSDQRDSSGNYTGYTAASVMFINPYVGLPIQMYPVWASTWTSGGPEANTTMWAVENEGGAPGNEHEPLNANQVANLFLIAQVWQHVTGGKISRATFREHGEVAKAYGYSPTACPSGRIQPFYEALEAEEEDLTPQEVETIVNNVISNDLRWSKLIDSSQVPELVAQILGVHEDTYDDPATLSIISAIRAKLFPPPGEGASSPSASAASLVAKAVKP